MVLLQDDPKNCTKTMEVVDKVSGTKDICYRYVIREPLDHELHAPIGGFPRA